MSPVVFSHRPSLLALLLCLGFAGISALAAEPRAVEARREIATREAAPAPPALAASAALRAGVESTPLGPPTGAGSEFGEQQIVVRRAHVEPWSVSLDTQVFSTDNVALTPRGTQRDWYLREGLALSYTNRVKGPWFADFSLQHYLFRYSKFDGLDFDLTRFEGGALLQLPRLNDAFLYARYSFQRIAEPNFGSSVLQSHSVIVGAQKVWKISRGMQVFAGLSADLPLDSDPRDAARIELGLTLGYSARLTEKLNASLSYRGSYYDYTEVSRRDWNHIAALGLTYDFTDWLRLGLNASYAINESDARFAAYRNLVLGANFSLHLSF